MADSRKKSVLSQQPSLLLKGIIIILGYSNNEQGELSEIAKSRLIQGMEEHRKYNYKLILTGGYGDNFNSTAKPHAYYSKQFLLLNHLHDNDILELALSRYTIEDALLTKPIVAKFLVKNLIIITSDFHLNRVRYIFDRVYSGYDLTYIAAKSPISPRELELLKEKEEKKLSRDKETLQSLRI